MPIHYFQPNEVLEIITPDGETLLLDNNYGRAVIAISGMSMPPITYNTITSQSSYGAFLGNYRFEPRNLTLSLYWQRNSRKDYNAARMNLLNVFRPNRGGYLTLRYYRAHDQIYDLHCYPDSSPNLDASSGTTINADIGLVALDPFWYDWQTTSVELDETGSTGFGFPYGFLYGFPYTGFAAKTITYAGTVLAYPTVTIEGPFTNLQIVNNTVGKVLYINSSLPSGRTLTLNLQPTTISATDDLGASYIDALGNSDLVGFALYPEGLGVTDGENEILASGSGYDGNTTITVTYQERYLGI